MLAEHVFASMHRHSNAVPAVKQLSQELMSFDRNLNIIEEVNS